MTTVWPTNAGMIDIESSRQNIRVRFPGSGLVRLKIMLGFMLTHFVNLKYDYRFFLSTNLLSVSLNRLSERLSIIENYHTVSLAPLVTYNDMGSSKSVRVCQELFRNHKKWFNWFNGADWFNLQWSSWLQLGWFNCRSDQGSMLRCFQIHVCWIQLW